MGFFKSFLGACIGIIAGVAIIVGYVYVKVRKIVGGGAKMKELVEAAKKAKDMEQLEYSSNNPRNVIGITNLIEPEIIRDFKDFNKDFLFSKVEKNLRTILTALEERTTEKVRKDKDLIYISSTVEEQIKDMRGQNYSVNFDDIKFHRHAIKAYNKSKGRATITVSSTLEYYYNNNSKNYKKKVYTDVKKQTRYTTQYVYVYDESAFDYNATTFSITCPNCGAALEFFGAGNCKYCGSYIEPINLKNWFIVSYKEDY